MKNNKFRINLNKSLLYAILAPALLSIIPVLLIWFQLENPYFLHYKFLKLLVYSLTFLIPVIVDSILGLIKIKTNDFVFFVVSYLIYFFIFTLMIYLYKKTKYKHRFTIKLLIIIVAYLMLSIFFLW